MVNAFHGQQTIEQGIHGFVARIFADGYEREEFAYTEFDRYKVYRQEDDGSFWILLDETVPEFVKLSTTSSVNNLTINAKKSTPGIIPENSLVRGVGYEHDGYEQIILVELAQADSDSTMPCIGIASVEIDNVSTNNVIVFGIKTNVDTSLRGVGDISYVSTAVAGDVTYTAPTGNNLVQPIWSVIDVGVNGVVFVNISNVRWNATTAPLEITDGLNDLGTINTAAKADHTHAHGTRGGGDLHAEASSIEAGFLSVDGYNKLESIEPGAQANTVDSVFGRTGDIVAVSGDYNSDQINNLSTVSGASVSDALDTLSGLVADAGEGNVSGPSVTTDNAITRWDGTDGYTIQNSGVILDDLDNITGVTSINSVVIEAHADRHESGGADEIDGYQLAIVYNPINYTAPNNDLLGEHLFRIDEALSNSGIVTSVFGRIGDILAEASDYDASQIDNDSNVPGAFVSDALNNLDSLIDSITFSLDGYALDSDLQNHITDFNNPHNTDIGNLGSGTLTELNSIITDATLDDAGDPRTPLPHASTHENGGSDEIEISNLGTSETDTALVLKPDGLGGVSWVVDNVRELDGYVFETRQIIAGAGLIGGGDLSADRTLDIVANADGSIVVNANDIQVGTLANDAQHGNLGGGSLHELADATQAGFFSIDGYNKLEAIEPGAQVNTVNSVFGRTGDVIAVSGDYNSDEVDNISAVPGASVSDALETLNALIIGGGSGTVSGPDTTTDNAIARWSGTDGYTIQNSGVIIDDLDNITGVNDLSVGGNITVVGTVDGRDVSVDGATLDAHIADSTIHFTLEDIGLDAYALDTDLQAHISDTNNPHATDIGNLGPGTLAELNAIITDATLDDAGDPRDPNLHASTHENGGTDEIEISNLGTSETDITLVLKPDGAGGVVWTTDNSVSLDGYVFETREVIAGAGLVGGGDLSADRTIDIVANADGSIIVNANDIQVGTLANDAQHGDLGGGSLHELASSIQAGFFSIDGYNKLEGIEDGAQVNTVDSVFGRTGDVIAVFGDYDSDQIDNVSAVMGSSVSDALETLNALIVGGGSGTVSGPDTTTDNAITRWSGTDGYTIQNSGVILDDLDNITGVNDLSVGGNITVVGTVDGVDVSAHASRHEFGGADTIEISNLSTSEVNTTLVLKPNGAGGVVWTTDDSANLDGYVFETRQIIAGGGVVGGGDLSADVTIDVVANADGSIVVNADDIQVGVLATDAQHGNRGGGNLHELADATQAGFFSIDGYNKLEGIEDGAQANTVDSVFGRTGDVVAEASDYDASQIDNDSSVVGTFVSDALDTLNNELSLIDLDGYALDADLQAHITDTNNPHNTSIANLGSGTLAELNAIVTDATLDDAGDPRTPLAHASTHESGGSDEVDGYQLSLVYAPTNYSTPSSDLIGLHLVEIDNALGGLSQSIDNIDLDGYALDADLQAHINDTANPHATDIGNLGSGTLAELNAIITDATLDDAGDPRTPLAHASTHESGGSDEIDGYQLALNYTPTNYAVVNDIIGEHIAAIDIALASAGGGTPGGPDRAIQFNDNGSFGGDARFEYTQTTDDSEVSVRAGTASATTTGYNIFNSSGTLTSQWEFDDLLNEVRFDSLNSNSLSITSDGAMLLDASSFLDLRLGSNELIRLNSTTETSLAADRVFTWDGSQNVYIDGYDITLGYTPENYEEPVNDVIGEHIAAIDDQFARSRPKVALQFVATEEISNFDQWLYSWRGNGSSQIAAARSGASNGLNFAGACSPIVVPADGYIQESTLVLVRGAVNNSTVSYPVTFTAILQEVGLNSLTTIETLEWEISNSFPIGTFSTSGTNTDFVGTINTNIFVQRGQLLAVKFIGTNTNDGTNIRIAQNFFINLFLTEF